MKNDDELIGKLMIDFIHAAHMIDRDISYGSDIHLGVKAVVEGLRTHNSETDFTKMGDASMVHECGMDAMKWAKAFCQHNPDNNPGEDVMIGWFANAIMHSLDLNNGTVINGDHAEYLIENNLLPTGA